MRDAAVNSRIQQLGHLQFMSGIVPRVQETHSHCFCAARGYFPGDGFRLKWIQRSVYLAGSEQPFLDFEREMSWDQRFRTFEPDIVRIGAIASANLVYVPRAPGDDERGTGAFAFQYGVDRDSGPMHKGIDRIHTHTGFLEAFANSLLQACGSGRAFGTQQPAGR